MPGDDPLDEPPGRFVVHPERAAAATRATPWTVIGAAVVVSVLALAAWGAIRTVDPPSGSPRSHAAGPGSGTHAPGAPAATPALAVADVDTADEALARLAALAGWGGCPVWRALEMGDPVSRTQAEAAIRDAGRETGMVEVPDPAGVPRRVWIGGDVQTAARGFGGSFVVREPDAAWTVVREDGREVAIRLAPSARRDGGTYWQVGGRAEPAPYCAPSATPAMPATGHARVLRVAGDPIAGVLEAAGWEGCGTWRLASEGPEPTTTAIEAAAARALVLPGGDGWADIAVDGGTGPRVRAWLGHDEPRAALAHGSTLMVFGDEDPDGPWLLTTFDHRPRLIQLRVVDTPGGWRSWLPTANVAGLSLGADPLAPACGAKAP